jgi:FlaA1/EpsC-like NDP-sugar epimerase
MGEKLVTAANYYKGNARTIFHSVRFGNVLGSRGSLIPLIEQQIINNHPITITHNEMTRYIMGAKAAINLILNTLEIAQGGEVFVSKMHTIKVIDLIEVLVEFFAEKHNKIKEKIVIDEVGMFVGEKLYEELFSIEESERTYEMKGMYLIFPQLTEVSRKIDMDKFPNLKKIDNTIPFNSKIGPYLTKKEIKELLIKINII